MVTVTGENVDESEPRTIEFKSFYWNYKETDDNELFITIGGRTAPDENGKTKSVHCIVENFTPFVYLELPKRIKWNKQKCKAVFEYFKKVMKSEGPINYSLLTKYKLQYKERTNCIWMSFPTNKAASSLAKRCHNNRTGLFIDGVGVFRSKEFTVHEQNLDPLLKFTASKKLKLASWVAATETIKPGDGETVEDRKFTTADVDLKVDWKDIEAFIPKNTIIVRPKYLSFDIECNSKNHNSKLPDPSLPENIIFQIGNTSGEFGGDPKLRKKTLFTLYNPHDILGATVIRCKTEKELLLKWRQFVEDENPDAMVGYNTMKFDWNYMISRAENLGIYMKFAQISRVIGERADNKQTAWSSSAYGEQKFRYLDPSGRTNVDVLLEIERNFKLPQYGLGAVGEYFLGETKDDITPRQLFMLVQLTQELGELVEALPKGVIPKERRIEIKKEIQRILQMRRCHGVVRKLRTDLMNAKTGARFDKLVRDALTLTGTYCLQDTVLPVKLCEKLNLWTTMEETSNCMNVPMSYLHTRGQQIKVLAQVYRDTIFNDIIIPHRERPKDGETEKYEGAVVIEANPGDYENVVCFDFESLYPSIMIAYNICHTTLLRENDPTPDSECHVLPISSHIGCEHDKQRRKKKKEDIMCHEHVHRFKKVIIRADGTRENEGIMAKLVRNLLVERKIVKKEMAKAEARMKMTKGLAKEEDIEFYKKMKWEIIEKGSLTPIEVEVLDVEIKVLNAKQLALKVSANSSYGTLGAQTGPIPLVAGAASVTAMGRMLIMKAIEYILKKYPGAMVVDQHGHEENVGKAKLVYGDSVTPDTPILIKHNGIAKYIRIEDLPRLSTWKDDYEEKEIAVPANVEVWSDKGFTKIKQIIRHKTNKNIYRVSTKSGSVDVTEDHSLLLPNGTEISPLNVKIGDKLMHFHFPILEDVGCKIKTYAAETEDPLMAAKHFFFAEQNGLVPYMEHGFSSTSRATYQIKSYSNATSADDLDCIEKITNLGPSNDYVYDLETENHHFAAGVGKMVVHNTDSSMITFVGKTTEESFLLGDQISKETSHYLKTLLLGMPEDYSILCPDDGVTYRIEKYPRDKMGKLSDAHKIDIYKYDSCPINLQFENLYKRYLLLSKKRYVAHAVNRKGEIVAKIKKGVVLARRDNCQYLRDTYSNLTEGILKYSTEEQVMHLLYDHVHKLFTRQIPDANLIIYTGVKTVMNYAKRKEKKQGRTVIERVFIDVDGEPIDDPFGPLDPRLVYGNLPQVLLALKMLRRGDDIPPNTRLEYLYLETPGATHQGQKSEDYTFYRENKDLAQQQGKPMIPDYLHYIQKQLAKPITELLEVKYPRQKVPYEKLDDALERVLESLDDLIKHRVKQIKVYDSSVGKGERANDGQRKIDDFLKPKGKSMARDEVGWIHICSVCRAKSKNGVVTACKKHASKLKPKIYTYRKKMAQVQYILDSAKRKKNNPKAMNEIDEKKYPEVIEICKKWKARFILDAMYAQYGVRKRPKKRPTQTGDKLRIKTKDNFVKVLLTRPVKSLNGSVGKKGDLVTLKDIKDTGPDKNDHRKKPKINYFYTIEFPAFGDDAPLIVENVPRDAITTWYLKDGTIMKDILIARGVYKCVIKELNILFNPIKYEGETCEVPQFEFEDDSED